MSSACYLLADIGGTNARFAYGDDAGLLAGTQRSFPNKDFAQFGDVLQTYLTECPPPRGVNGGCIAVAGPVAGDVAELTNRNWVIDAQAAARATGAPGLRLINDLSALARSTACLAPDQVTQIRQGNKTRGNGQTVVLGLGTGVNCATRITMAGRDGVVAAEIGHTPLPRDMADLLARTLGTAPEASTTVEDILSGRGFERLFQQLSGKTCSGEAIASHAEAGTDPQAAQARDLYRKLVALYLPSLALHFMPKDGIYLAGSVARSLLGGGCANELTAPLDRSGPMEHVLRDIPLGLIVDDAAALSGCLETAKDPA
ncbi:glucokinase [Neptunicoccus cionae]|uniref:glucokinase n=1 Tax=Neptunicoccus cionae TaxID=2035344 RepID=UPI000C78AD59|nr:ROK family protein [Amylibacter cionae]PLS20376.1 glucokinase [Amylibacter cionae]